TRSKRDWSSYVCSSDLDGTAVHRKPYTAELDAWDIEKGTYPHFMLKEIDEQPIVMRKIIKAYQNENNELKLDRNVREAIKACDRDRKSVVQGKNADANG